jgi:hypothetical protein
MAGCSVYDWQGTTSENAVSSAQHTIGIIEMLRDDARDLEQGIRDTHHSNVATITLYKNALNNIRTKLDAKINLWRVVKANLINARDEILKDVEAAGVVNAYQVSRYYNFVQDLIESV